MTGIFTFRRHFPLSQCGHVSPINHVEVTIHPPPPLNPLHRVVFTSQGVDAGGLTRDFFSNFASAWDVGQRFPQRLVGWLEGMWPTFFGVLGFTMVSPVLVLLRVFQKKQRLINIYRIFFSCMLFGSGILFWIAIWWFIYTFTLVFLNSGVSANG